MVSTVPADYTDVAENSMEREQGRRKTSAGDVAENTSSTQQREQQQGRRKTSAGAYFRSVTMPPRLDRQDTGATTASTKKGRFSVLHGPRRRLSNEKDGSSRPGGATIAVPVDTRSVEEKRLNRIVSETGEDSWGVDAVEVWILENGNSGRLIRPNGAYWRNPDMMRDEFLSRLEDTSNPMYVPPEPISVGVDLPGHLWTESIEGHDGGGLNLSGRGGNIFGGGSTRGGTLFGRSGPPTQSGSGRGGSLLGSLRGGNRFGNKAGGAGAPQNGSKKGGKVFTGGSLKGGDVFAALSQAMGKPSMPPRAGDDISEDEQTSTNNSQPPSNSDAGETKPQHRRLNTWSRMPKFLGTQQTNTDDDGRNHPRIVLNWRDIHSLVEDPDTPKTPRLVLIHNAGFNYAAGVSFSSGGYRGLVIFLTQLKEDSEQLMDFHNQVCMIRAAEAIGCVVASNEARKATMAARPTAASDEDIIVDSDKDDFPSENPWEKSACVTVKKRAATWSKKCLGGSLQIPPAMTLRQSLWTLLGCFCALLLLSGLSDVIRSHTDDELFFFMGPIGALMALQFGLTAAPASQPRNVLLGQAVAGAVSLCFTYIPDNIFSTWLRQAIAPSVAIAMMGKLGVLHPPAGAASIILTSGRYGWQHYGLLLVSSAISLLPAVIINNASLKRQYPTHSWWAMFFVSNHRPK